MESFKKTNYLIGGMGLIAGLSRIGEYNPRYLALLDELADEERFYHGAKGSKRLADAYLRLGEFKKAEYWHKKAKQKGYKEVIPPLNLQEPFLKTGVVEGKVLIDDEPVEGVKAGLLWVNPNLRTDEDIRVSSSHFIPRVASGTTTDSKGIFQLNNLLKGDYCLVLMAKSDLFTESMVADGGPGRLRLNNECSYIDLGTINIQSGKD